MSDSNPNDGGTPETPTTDSGGPQKDIGKAIAGMQMAEKILGASALLYLLGFIIDRPSHWRVLFRFGSYGRPWMFTLGFVGAVGALVLIGTKLFGVKLVDAKLYIKLLILCAILPAVGLLIDSLSDFWGFAILLSTIAMAYAGAKITTREKILK